MKERPILFSGEMVRAILDRRKTQTRRVVTVPWGNNGKRTLPYEPYYNWDDGELTYMDDGGSYEPMDAMSPYGQPGDRLWVRETFDASGPISTKPTIGDDVIYRADHPMPYTRWRPSIHMPRWASRIDLLVTGVRVERLQEIGEADAKAEGVEPCGNDAICGGREHVHGLHILWDSINGKKPGRAWDDNPWVWVVEFEVQP